MNISNYSIFFISLFLTQGHVWIFVRISINKIPKNSYFQTPKFCSISNKKLTLLSPENDQKECSYGFANEIVVYCQNSVELFLIQRCVFMDSPSAKETRSNGSPFTPSPFAKRSVFVSVRKRVVGSRWNHLLVEVEAVQVV